LVSPPPVKGRFTLCAKALFTPARYLHIQAESPGDNPVSHNRRIHIRDLMDFSATGHGRVALWPLIGTLASIAVSLAYVFVFQTGASPSVRTTMIAGAIIMPIVLAPPFLIYLTLQNRKLALAERRLQVLANIDSLTSLLNRGAFTRELDRALAAGASGALLFLEADYFKSVNDRFGHAQGDYALRIIANAIRLSVRENDIVGRLGGEEFAVFLPEAGIAETEAIAERIRASVAGAPFRPLGKRHRLTISVGGTVFSAGADAAGLFRSADKRLYQAKDEGRDRAIVGTGMIAPDEVLAAAAP
jgi:diguanylate cyclase